MADSSLDREEKLKAVLFRSEQEARSWQDSELTQHRVDSLDYYDRNPRAFPSDPGQSKVITSEYADTIESIKPALMRAFTASGENIVKFSPDQPGDEQAAQEASDYIPHVIMRENDGFRWFYWFLTDALMYRLSWGVVDVEEVEEVKSKAFGPIPSDAFAVLSQQATQAAEKTKADVEIEATEDGEKRTQASVDYSKGMPNAHCGICKHFTGDSCELVEGPISADMWCKLFEERQPTDPPAQPTTFSGKITVRRKVKKVRIDNIAPEDGLISANARTIDDASFLGYRKEVTASYLREMGLDQETIDGLSTDDQYTTEENQRQPDAILSSDRDKDDSERKLWIVVAFVKFDWDGDGKSEMLRVAYAHAGGQVSAFVDGPEEWTDGIAPMVAGSPILMSHTVPGRSLFDQVKDLQQVGTAATRGLLDNLYLNNRPRPIIGDNVDLASLIDWTPGMPIRMRQGHGPIENEISWIQPPSVMADALGVLQWQEQVKQRRTGVTPNNQGQPDEAMNPTATGAAILTSAADSRIELIAQTFANGPITRLMRLVYRAVKRAAEGGLQYWNGSSFVSIDPTKWPDDMKLEVNVGGVANRVQQMQALGTIAAGQEKIWEAQGLKPGPVLNLTHLANTLRKGVEITGYKNTQQFVADDQEIQQGIQQQAQQPPPPDPDMMKVQAQAQAKQTEIQLKAQSDAQQQQHDAMLAQQKLAADIETERQKAAADMQIKREAAALDMQLAREKAALDAQLKQQELGLEARLGALEIAMKERVATNAANIKEQQVTSE